MRQIRGEDGEEGEREEPFALETDSLLSGSRHRGSQFYESEPGGLRVGIEIRNLRKVSRALNICDSF